jgi:hypothetical protein
MINYYWLFLTTINHHSTIGGTPSPVQWPSSADGRRRCAAAPRGCSAGRCNARAVAPEGSEGRWSNSWGAMASCGKTHGKHSWLVVDLPLWQILISWDDDIPNIWKDIKHVPKHQPDRCGKPMVSPGNLWMVGFAHLCYRVQWLMMNGASLGRRNFIMGNLSAWSTPTW